jgi:hypothetical protein
MAAISAFAEKLMLDWVLGGAAATQPTTRAIGLSLGSPTSTSGSEIATTFGYTRQTMAFGAAASPGGSVTNASALTYSFTTAASVSGINIWDTVLQGGSGNLLWYGLLATARTVASGDSLVLASGALTISLA